MIFTILRIIGIIILCILALILLAVLLILFAPFRYYGEITYDKADNNLYILLRVTWLLIFKAGVSFKEKTLSYYVNALFLKIIDSDRGNEDTSKDHSQTNEAKDIIVKPNEIKPEELKSEEKKPEEKKHKESEAKDNKKSIFELLNPAVWYYRISNKFWAFFDKISKSREALKKKFFEICNMISSEENRNMLVFLFAELKKVLKHIRPSKHGIYVKEGFKDPSLTGEVMAAYSVINSISSLNIVVCPDFDNEVLSVRAFAKGRIRVFNLLVTGIRVYNNKTLKKLIRRK